MSKIKAVVLEKTGPKYTVLGPNGTFRQVYRRQNAEIGEEIELSTGIELLSGLRVWAGAAAVFLLCLTAFLGWNLYQAPTAAALFSVDINPSVQFTLDSQGHLISLQMQNEDAQRMLSKTNLQGKSLDSVLGQIITQAIQQQFLTLQHHWVVVGYSPMTSNANIQMPKELNKDQIMALVTQELKKQGFAPQVAVFDLTLQERELAQKKNLTLGEYALWETAQNAGVVTQPDTLKDTSERVRVLEDPKVQEQLNKEKKGRLVTESTKKINPSSPSVNLPNPPSEKDQGQKQEDVTIKRKDSPNTQQKTSHNEQGKVQTKEINSIKSNSQKESKTQNTANNGHDTSKNQMKQNK